jgi:hypothetical protein
MSAQGGMDEGEVKRIVSLFEMGKRGSQDGADDNVRHEATNAIGALFRLLGKHGLDWGDIPELQRRHEQNEAAKTSVDAGTTGTASAATAQGIAKTDTMAIGVVQSKSGPSYEPTQFHPLTDF